MAGDFADRGAPPGLPTPVSVGLVLGCLALANCVSFNTGSGAPGTRLTDQELADVGFPEREVWPTAVLHLDREQVRGAERLSNVLRRSGEVVLRRPVDGGWGIYAPLPGGGECEIGVYLNGERHGRRERAGSRFDVDGIIAPAAIDGLELHLGADGPVRSFGMCGSLLIWSGAIPEMQFFRGRIIAEVTGNAADTITGVVLQSTGEEGRGGSGYYEFRVRPGVYEVAFMSGDEALDVRRVRAFAYADSNVGLEVTR